MTAAAGGAAELRMPWHDEAGQLRRFLQVGVVSALVDTVCGFAAATVAGNVVASHCTVSYLAPAAGDAFVASGEVVKAGKRQVFGRAEVFAESGAGRKLVATGETVLLRVDNG